MAHAQRHMTDDITGSDGTCAEARDIIYASAAQAETAAGAAGGVECT